jgi:hypothetical protein
MDETPSRRAKRRQLVVYLRVVDRDSGEELGSLADITGEGLMLVGNQPLQLGRDYRLRVEGGEAGGPQAGIDLVARSLWTRPDLNPALHLTGFELVEPNAETLRRINDLILDLGFAD